ncbi:MAG: hypothetical protein ACKN9V_09980 [Pseudomonadota bacterium]
MNDDWVYTRNVVDSLAAGKFVVSSGQYAYAIPQVLLGLLLLKPGQEPFLVLRWMGILSAVSAALVMVRLCQKAINGNSSMHFVLGAIATFFFVPYLQPSLSFMTDAPAFFLWVLSLWSLSWFLKKKTFNSWVLALLSNAVAVSERQLAIFIPFAMVIAQNLDFRPKDGLKSVSQVFRRSYPVMLFVFPLVVIQWWWTGLSPVKVPDSSFSPNPGVLIRISRQLIYLGWTALPFFLLPIKGVESPQEKKTFKWCLSIFCIGFFLHVINWAVFKSPLLPPFYGNVLDKVGILPVLLPGTPETIFPDYFRWVLLFLGLMGMVRILRGFAILWNDKERSHYAEVILWSSLIYFIFMCFRGTQFDRYFIPVLPLSLLCIFKNCPLERLTPMRSIATAVVCFLYIAFSTSIVSDYFRWNEARKEALDFAFSKGLKPTEVCAGYEYEGWYQTGSDLCSHKISFSELPNFNIEQTFRYPSIWGSHQRYLYLLKSKSN